ncbi:MAG: glycosyltransferase [Candidatus Ventricola sp.]
MRGRNYTDGKCAEELIGHIGFGEPVMVDTEAQKRVLVAGAGSYIGEAFRRYADEHYPALAVDTVGMMDGTWREKDFSAYDVVYHVAGIAHADVGDVDDAKKETYYTVNTDLAVEVCKKAKAEGVKEFIFMSSMIVYGESAPYGKKKVVDEHTVPHAASFYGDSKLQADMAVRDLSDDRFKVLVLRPPMVYGRGSKGNYPVLAKLAKKLPIFPNIDNERSMLHIDNFCEFLCQIMLIKEIKENAVVLMPQNAEWTKTSEMVKEIAAVSGKKIRLTGILKPAVWIAGKVPGRIGGLANKAFGNSCYKQSMSEYKGIDYQKLGLKESVAKTEKTDAVDYGHASIEDLDHYSVLMSVYKNDQEDYLRLAIESMLNQSCAPEQFVLVEDGPISHALEHTIAEYSEKYPDLFTVVRLKENGGLGNALNQGLKVCRNELIARMDSDDISKPDRCAKQLEAFRKEPEIGILGTQIDEFIDDTTNIVSQRIVPTTHEGIAKFAKRRSPFNHPTVMYRKSVINRLNGYNTYARKEDLDLFVRAVNEGIYTKNLEESLLFYRTSRDNLKRRKTWINCKEYIQVMIDFKKQGYIGYGDLAYVVVGQLAIFLMPDKLAQLLIDKLLRKK